MFAPGTFSMRILSFEDGIDVCCVRNTVTNLRKKQSIYFMIKYSADCNDEERKIQKQQESHNSLQDYKNFAEPTISNEQEMQVWVIVLHLINPFCCQSITNVSRKHGKARDQIQENFQNYLSWYKQNSINSKGLIQ